MTMRVRAVLVLACKDLKLLLRDRVAAFFTLVFPVLFGLAFGFIFKGAVAGDPGPVRAVLIDFDGSAASEAVGAGLADAGVEVHPPPEEGPRDARTLVQHGVPVVVVLEEGFGDGLDRVIVGERLEARVFYDPARAIDAKVVEGALQGAMMRAMAVGMREPGRLDRWTETLESNETIPDSVKSRIRGAIMMARVGAEPEDGGSDDGVDDADGGDGGGFAMPVRVALHAVSGSSADKHEPVSAFELTLPQAAAWALVGCVTGFGLSLVSERSRGTLGRVLAGPVGPGTVLAGKALACFVCAVGVLVAIRLVFAVPYFGVRTGQVGWQGAVIVASAFAFTGLMMVLAVLPRSDRGAEGVVRATLLMMALLGGAGVPLMFFHGWMELLTHASPFRWAIIALEGATWRGWGAVRFVVPLTVLMGVGVGGLVLGWVVFRGRACRS